MSSVAIAHEYRGNLQMLRARRNISIIQPIAYLIKTKGIVPLEVTGNSLTHRSALK
jgi:hypothetical protein